MAATTRRKSARLARRRTPGRARMIEIEVLARETGLHPDVVRRLVRLGLVDPSGGTVQAPLFRPDAASRLARALRLRRDLGLNYAGAVLASELLARIDQLEQRLRRYEPPTNRRR
jgi:DNA-binding transcriptional MerR regulator